MLQLVQLLLVVYFKITFSFFGVAGKIFSLKMQRAKFNTKLVLVLLVFDRTKVKLISTILN